MQGMGKKSLRMTDVKKRSEEMVGAKFKFSSGISL